MRRHRPGLPLQDELTDDVAEEVSKFGEVERMTLFSKHADGVIMVGEAPCRGESPPPLLISPLPSSGALQVSRSRRRSSQRV